MNSLDDFEQQRKYPRFDVNQHVQYRLQGDENWASGRIVNVSMGGGCLVPSQPLVRGQRLELYVETRPGGHTRLHRINAIVVWSNYERAGISFETFGK